MAKGQYDDAWETPGWTAQNFAYPPSDLDDGVDLPVDIDRVTLTGKFLDGRGDPAEGWLYISMPTALEHTPTKTKIMPVSLRAEVKKGAVSVEVPATDALTVVPEIADWRYKIRVVLKGRTFLEAESVALPRATPTVDLFDIT